MRLRDTVKLAILLLLASCCTCSAQQPSTEPSATSGNQVRPRRQDSHGLLDPQEPQSHHSARPHQGPTQAPEPQQANYYQKRAQSQNEQVNSQQLNGPQQAGSNLDDDLEQRERSSSFQGSHVHRARKIAHPRRKSSGSVPGRAGRDFPSLSAIPRTGFRCKRGHPGYFADPETGCQVFHICQTTGRKSSFLCPAGSIFNQRYLVCDWWFDTTCEVSPNHVPQTTGLDDNSISPGQGDLSLEASVYPRKPGGIHGNNVDDTANSKPTIQQSNPNNNRQGSTYSFSFSQEHEPNTAVKFNNALTKFSPGVSYSPTEAFTVSSINFDTTKPSGNSHHSYQSQNFFFPHRFSTMSPALTPTARPKQDQVESNSSTPYNHRPTYDAEPDDLSLKQPDQSAFSERNEQPAYSPGNANAQTPRPNYEQTSLLGESNAQPLTSSAPILSNSPTYNLQSDTNQFYSPKAQTASTTTSSPLTSPYPQTNNQYQSVSQYQQSNNQPSENQYTETSSQLASTNSNTYHDSDSQNQQNNNQPQQTNQYQLANNQYQTSSQYPQTVNQYQTNYSSQYQQTSSQYPQTVNQYQTNYSSQYQQTSSQYPQTVNQYQTNYSSQYQQTENNYQPNQYQQSNSQYQQRNNNQFQFDNTTPVAVPLDLNSTQPQQYTTNTAVPQAVQQPITSYQQPITTNEQPNTNYRQPFTNYQQTITNYQQPILNYQQPRESLQTSSTGNIHDNNQQYSTTAPVVSETTQSSTDQTFTTYPTVPSSVPNKPYSNAESSSIFASTPVPEVSNDIRTNFFTDQTVPSTAEPTTQTAPPQTTDPTSSPKPVEVPTITPVPYHEPFSVTASSPSPFTLSTTHSPLSENDVTYTETTEHPSTANDDLKTTFDGSDSQTTFLGDVNQINHALDNPVKPIDVEIDNHQSSVDQNQSPSPPPFTFNVGQGFAQEATPTSTPTSNHFSRFIIDIPDEVSSIKSTSFGQVGNEVQGVEEHAAPSYPFTARVNDFLSAINHHDTPPVSSPPENVSTVAVTQPSPTVTKMDKFTLADVSSPSNEIRAPLASSESHSAAPSIVSLPFGARLRAPKRRIYRRRIVV